MGENTPNRMGWQGALYSVLHVSTRMNCMFLLLLFFFFRICDDLSKKEKSETDEFLEDCIIDPSLRQRLSILSRTFENQRKLVQADSMLFLNTIFTIEPLVST